MPFFFLTCVSSFSYTIIHNMNDLLCKNMFSIEESAVKTLPAINKQLLSENICILIWKTCILICIFLLEMCKKKNIILRVFKS